MHLEHHIIKETAKVHIKINSWTSDSFFNINETNEIPESRDCR